MSAAATEKQVAYIIKLANARTGRSDRFISQVVDVLPISKSAARSLTASDASVCIEHLLTPLPEQAAAPAEPAISDAVTAEDLLSMIGREVEIVGASGRTYAGRIGRIEKSVEREVLVLKMDAVGSHPSIPVDRIVSWRFA